MQDDIARINAELLDIYRQKFALEEREAALKRAKKALLIDPEKPPKSQRSKGRKRGSIYQRPDGRWAGVVVVSKGPPRKRKTFYGWDKAEVEARVEQALNPVPVEHQSPQITAAIQAMTQGQQDRFVYFARQSGQKTIKIGVSSNPERRLKSFRTGAAEPVLLMAVVPGGRTLEAHLHEAFAADRVQGEWFRLTPPLRAVIQGLAKASA